MRYQQIISVAFTWSLFVTTPTVKTSALLLHRISGVSSSTRRAPLHTNKIVLGFSHRQTSTTMSGRGEYYKNKYGGGGRGGGRGRGGGGGGGGSGRGEYYKNKYGGGGRGGGRGGRGGGNQGNNDSNNNYTAQGGGSYVDLQNCLRRLDGKSYGAYHDLDTPEDRGWMNTQAGYALFVGRAQSDPFSPPTRCRVIVNAATAGFPKESYSNRIRAMATSDFLLRTLYEICKQQGADASLGGQGWSGPKGGDIQVLQPGQHVLEQSAVRIETKTGNVIAQITINLPARGRTILGHAAETILMQTLPTLVQRALLFRSLNSAALKSHVFSIEDQCWLQSQLESRNLVAFVRNGAILPRYSGVDDRPMKTTSAVPFESPKRLEVSFDLPNAGKTISGMGIPKGITLICGGGFHGKSTLLEALQVGIYPKIPGDGREYCAMSQNASKIRAEDGRNVQSVDISAFINNLPFGKDTSNFSTPDASGSTSQATNILEAVEIGADTLLIDEDTCATNFMVRDSKMIQLVAPDKEPITPFVRVIRSLYDEFGISSVLVIGGVGDFFRQSDNVLVMDCYKCLDATERAKQIVAAAADEKEEVVPDKPFHKGPPRIVNGSAILPNGKVKVLSQSSISYGETELDISSLEQLVAKAQTAAISNALQRYGDCSSRDGLPMKDVLTEMDKRIDTDGLDILSPGQFHGGMSRPRMLEVAGALNRLRRQSIAQLR